MRKLIEKSFVIALAGILATVSCTKEAPETQVPSEPEAPIVEELVPMEFTASAATKTYVGADGTTLLWQEGDEIAIFDGYGKREFKIKEGTLSGASVTFTGEVDAKATEFYAVYPYDKAEALSSGNLVASLAAEQTLSGTNTPQGSFVAVAKASSTGALSFANVVAYLKINVENAGKVKTIEVNGTALAGTATFSPAGVLQSTSTELGTVTFKPAGATFDAGTYYLPVFPGTTAAGSFSVSLNGDEAVSAERTASVAVTLERNKGLEFDKIDSDLKWYYKITDAATLQTFLTGDPGCENGKLQNDIDLSGVTLAPGAELTGTLHGNGKSLTNWAQEGDEVLFTEVSGLVRNLTIASNCTLTGSTGYYGAICRTLKEGGVVKNVTNNAPLTITAGTLAEHLAAGALVGLSYGDIEASENHGSVTVTVSDATGYEVSAGGVLGRTAYEEGTIAISSNHRKLTNVINAGDVTVNVVASDHGVSVGGVIGYAGNFTEAIGTAGTPANTGAVKFNGTISFNSETGKEEYGRLAVGGYCGLSEHSSYTNIENNGQVSTESGSTATNIFVGGILGTTDAYRAIDDRTYSSPYTTVALVDCKNLSAGTVTNNANCNGQTIGSNNYGRVAIGGILGASTNGNKENCENHAAVLNKGVANLNTGNSGAGVAGLFGMHNGGSATWTNCKNYGTVTDQSETPYYVMLGGLVGRIFGSSPSAITNCTNDETGTITRSTATTKAANLYAAGLVGYSTQELRFTGTNENRALVNMNTEATNAVLGGIVGYASTSAISNVNNYGSVTATKCPSGYLVIAGLIGQVNKTITITNSKNEGPLDIKATTKASNLYVGGSIGYVGGNTCDIQSSVSNSGNITITAPATNLYVGGNFGYGTGTVTVSSSNTGAIELKSTTAATDLNVGGLAAYAGTITLNSGATNEGPITVSTPSTNLYVGGNLGHGMNNITASSSNTGAITINSTAKASTKLFVGGIIGFGEGAAASIHKITNVSNGISGSATDGKIVVNAASGDQLGVSGVAGRIDRKVTFSGAKNYAPIDLTSGAKTATFGGIAAWTNLSSGTNETVSSYTSCDNHGKLTVNGGSYTSGLYFGGVLAYVDQQVNIKSCNNNAPLEAKADATIANLRMGGVLGNASGVHTLDACTNNAPLNSYAKVSGTHHLGGVVGQSAKKENTVKLSNLTNSGNLTAGNAAQPHVGGIFSQAESSIVISNLKNTGDLTVETTSTAITKEILIGGICSYWAGWTYTNCDASGTYTSTTTTNNAFIGGMCGKSNNANITFKDCDIAVDIVYGGTSPTTTYGAFFIGAANNNNHKLTAGTASNGCTVKKGSTINGISFTDKSQVTSSDNAGNSYIFGSGIAKDTNGNLNYTTSDITYLTFVE